MWLITALFALILAGWSVLAPLYHSPDEKEHADAVMRLEEGRGWPSAATASLTPEGVGAYYLSPTARVFTHTLDGSVGTLPPQYAQGRHIRPTWENAAKLHGTSARYIQQIPQHPPGYYWYEAALLRLGGAAGWRWDIAVSTMRLLSALLMVWLPLLCWATAWRFTGKRLAGIAASVVPLAVPSLAQIGASINNDNLLTLSGAAIMLGLTCAMRGDRTRSCALWTGIWLAIALWTKAFALLLIPLVILVYTAPWLRERWQAVRARAHPPSFGGRLRSWLPDRRIGALLGLSAGVGIAIGCWWYVVNEIRYGSTLPPVHGLSPGNDIGHRNWEFLREATQMVLWRWWGSIGWSEVNTPWRLVIVATVVAACIGIIGLLRSPGRRLALLALLWPTVTTYLLVVGKVTHDYLQTHHVAALAGRYLYVGFTGVAVIIGVGCACLPRKVGRWSPLLLLIAGLGIQAETAHLAVNRWWRPIGGTLRQAWDAFSVWSTWPVGVLWTGLALLAVLAVAAFAALLLTGIRGFEADIPSRSSEPSPAAKTPLTHAQPAPEQETVNEPA